MAKSEVCTCYFECKECTHSGDWHVHPNELCPIHPEAPGDH